MVSLKPGDNLQETLFTDAGCSMQRIAAKSLPIRMKKSFIVRNYDSFNVD